MPLTIANFKEFARQTKFQDSDARIEAGTIKEDSITRMAFTFTKGHAVKAMGEFLDAVRKEYGDKFADIIGKEMKGKRLTARHINQVIGQAEKLQGDMTCFQFGIDQNGKAIQGSLENALAGWQAVHPSDPPLPAEKCKAQILQHIRDNPRDFPDISSMFSLVANGLPSQKKAAEDIANIAKNQASPAQLREFGGIPQQQPPLSDKELGQLQQAFSARLLGKANGGFEPAPTEEEARGILEKLVEDYLPLRSQAMGDPQLSDPEKTTLCSQLVEKGILISPEALAQKAETLHNAKINTELAQQVSGDAEKVRELATTILKDALGENYDESLVTEKLQKAFAESIRSAIELAGDKGKKKLGEEEAKKIASETVGAWAKQFAKATQGENEAETAGLRKFVAENPDVLNNGQLAKLREATAHASAKALGTALLKDFETDDLQLLLKAARTLLLPVCALPAPELQKQAISLIAMRIDPEDQTGLYNILKNAISKELKVALQVRINDEGTKAEDKKAAQSLLDALKQLQRALGAQLKVDAEQLETDVEQDGYDPLIEVSERIQQLWSHNPPENPEQERPGEGEHGPKPLQN
jgi:hypothetical protein